MAARHEGGPCIPRPVHPYLTDHDHLRFHPPKERKSGPGRGISGLRPSTPRPEQLSHPDCRGALILIAALHFADICSLASIEGKRPTQVSVRDAWRESVPPKISQLPVLHDAPSERERQSPPNRRCSGCRQRMQPELRLIHRKALVFAGSAREHKLARGHRPDYYIIIVCVI
jgi:hypothetical protein